MNKQQIIEQINNYLNDTSLEGMLDMDKEMEYLNAKKYYQQV